MGNTESTSLLKCVNKNGQLDQERYFHYRRQVDNETQEHHKAAAAVSDVNSKKIRTLRHRSCKRKERGKVCECVTMVLVCLFSFSVVEKEAENKSGEQKFG